MRSFKFHLAFSLLAGVFLNSCTKVETPPDLGYSYYPTDLGRYYVYQVDSVVVDCKFSIRDTFQYQIKEYYDTTFLDASDEVAIRMERYRRAASSDSWLITDVWSLKQLPTRMEKVEENNRIVKMAFPVVSGTEWDGNAFNYIDDWGSLYRYETPDVPLMVGSVNYDSTVTVLQKEDENLLYRKYYAETYARNVGMVQRTKIDITGIVAGSVQSCENLLNGQLWTTIPIMNRIASGSVVTYRLVEYGFE